MHTNDAANEPWLPSAFPATSPMDRRILELDRLAWSAKDIAAQLNAENFFTARNLRPTVDHVRSALHRLRDFRTPSRNAVLGRRRRPTALSFVAEVVKDPSLDDSAVRRLLRRYLETEVA